MKTYQKLAVALREVGLDEMAARADEGYYHDYLSPLAMPSLALAEALAQSRSLKVMGSPEWHAINNLRNRHLNGEFDADLAESDEWMASPEGRDAFDRLAKGK